MPESILAAIIGGLAGLLVAIANNHFGRRKNNADAAGAITDAATTLIKPLEDRIIKLEKENKELRENQVLRDKKIADLESEVVVLREENATLRSQIQRPGLAKKK